MSPYYRIGIFASASALRESSTTRAPALWVFVDPAVALAAAAGGAASAIVATLELRPSSQVAKPEDAGESGRVVQRRERGDIVASAERARREAEVIDE